MSVPTREYGNAARRKRLGNFLGAALEMGGMGALATNPTYLAPMIASQVAQPILSNIDWSSDGTISRQQADKRNERARMMAERDQQGRQKVQQWINNGGNTGVGSNAPTTFQNVAAQLQASGMVDPNNPNPPAGIDKALAGKGNIFQNVGTQIQQAQGQGQKPDNIFQSVSNTIANNGQSNQRTGMTRMTDWDTNDIYAVVSKLSNEDYDELESIQDKDTLIDVSSDTTLNLLEDHGIHMSPELEQSFKGGIGAAMDDWYQQQRAAGKPADMTSYLMGMTQFALALVDEYGGQAAGQTPNQIPTDQGNQFQNTAASIYNAQEQIKSQPVNGMPSEEQFMLLQGQGQIPPEFYQGFEAWLERNPNGSFQEYISGGGQ